MTTFITYMPVGNYQQLPQQPPASSHDGTVTTLALNEEGGQATYLPPIPPPPPPPPPLLYPPGQYVPPGTTGNVGSAGSQPGNPFGWTSHWDMPNGWGMDMTMRLTPPPPPPPPPPVQTQSVNPFNLNLNVGSGMNIGLSSSAPLNLTLNMGGFGSSPVGLAGSNASVGNPFAMQQFGNQQFTSVDPFAAQQLAMQQQQLALQQQSSPFASQFGSQLGSSGFGFSSTPNVSLNAGTAGLGGFSNSGFNTGFANNTPGITISIPGAFQGQQGNAASVASPQQSMMQGLMSMMTQSISMMGQLMQMLSSMFAR